MKKIKLTLLTLMVTIIISLILIVLLESNNLQSLRNLVIIVLPFLEGKKAVFSNIFLGILASAFCMFLGELVTLICLEVSLKKEIKELFNELWVNMNFKNGNSRKDYVDNAIIFIQHNEQITKLYVEFENKKCIEYLIISLFYYMLFLYKYINETEYMRTSNNTLFKNYVDVLYKTFNNDLKTFYYMSEYDEEIMQMRKNFEKRLNEEIVYNSSTDCRIDEYINEIRKIESKLNTIYDNLIKSDNYLNSFK